MEFLEKNYKSILAFSGITILYLMSSNKAFAKVTASGKIRGCDSNGCGTYGASRGGHTHQGEDYITLPGETIFSPIDGKITRVAYPYPDDLSFKGIEIKNATHSVKIFYMIATVNIGSSVKKGQAIGQSQSLLSKYPGITNHVHVEVRTAKNVLLKLSDLV